MGWARSRLRPTAMPAQSARVIECCTQRDTGKTRALVYRLYSLAERKRWVNEAYACNILVTSWPQIRAEAARLAVSVPEQVSFGFSEGEAS